MKREDEFTNIKSYSLWDKEIKGLVEVEMSTILKEAERSEGLIIQETLGSSGVGARDWNEQEHCRAIGTSNWYLREVGGDYI